MTFGAGWNRLLYAAMFCFVNFLFVWKYSARITAYALAGSLIYVVLLFSAILFFEKLPEAFFRRWIRYVCLIAFIVAGILVLHYLPVGRVRVDRWDIVQRFLDALFHGEYPYKIRSMHNNTPGPLPVYFLLSVPFYLIRELGYATLSSLLVFVWLVEKQLPAEKDRAFVLLFLMSSPAFLWEIAVRSTLFFNVVFVLLYAHFAERLRPACTARGASLSGFGAGLVLSTRGVFVLPLAATFCSLFVRSGRWFQGALHATMLAAGFALTLAPFAVWDWNAFRVYNPVTLERGFVSLPVLIVLVLASAYAGIRSSSLMREYGYLGAILFSAASLSFLKFAGRFGWRESFWGSRFDISYFMLALPCILIGLAGANGDRRRVFPQPQ